MDSYRFTLHIRAGHWLRIRSVLKGDQLKINYSTSAAGSIRVGIGPVTGEMIAGFSLGDSATIIGDEIEKTISWKNGSSLSSLEGKPVRLYFEMKDSDLHSIRCQ